jgi:hypothetical protein
VGIFATLWAGVWTTLAILYVGTIGAMFGTMCCLMSSLTSAAADGIQQRQAVDEIATAQLGREVSVENFSVTGTGDSRYATGIAVYTAEDGKQLAVDFSCQLDKVSGTWEASNFQTQGEPYPRTPPISPEAGSMPPEGTDPALDGGSGAEAEATGEDGSVPAIPGTPP